MDQEPRTPGEELKLETEVAPPAGADAAAVSAESEPRSAAEVRQEIEQTRRELGDTAAALAEKTDVKGQARRAAANARQTLADDASHLRESITSSSSRAGGALQAKTPTSVGDGARQASGLVRDNRPAVIAFGALALGFLLGRSRAR